MGEALNRCVCHVVCMCQLQKSIIKAIGGQSCGYMK